jgi:hypothetical protein
MQAGIDTVHDQGNFQLGENQLESQLEDLADAFLPGDAVATGVTMDDLLGAISPPRPHQQTASSSSSTGSTSSGRFLGGFFGGRVSQVAPPQTSPQQAAPTPAPPTRRASTGSSVGTTGGTGSGNCSGGTSTGAGASTTGKRGRPPTPLLERVTKLLEDFAEAPLTSARFFSTEVKAQMKTMVRMQEEMGKQPPDDEHAVAAKKLTAVVNVVKAYAKHGGCNAQFVSAMEETRRFLSMEPEVTDWKCPPELTRECFKMHVQTQDKDDDFWKLLSPASLTTQTFELDSHHAVRAELISLRIVEIVRGSTSDNVQDKLAAFSSQRFLSAMSHLSPLDQEAVKAIGMIAKYSDVGIDYKDLEKAVAEASNKDNQITSALSVPALGRELIKNAGCRVAELKKLAALSSIVENLLKDLDTALSNYTLDGGFQQIVCAWDLCDSKFVAEGISANPDMIEKVFYWDLSKCCVELAI